MKKFIDTSGEMMYILFNISVYYIKGRRLAMMSVEIFYMTFTLKRFRSATYQQNRGQPFVLPFFKKDSLCAGQSA